MRCDKCNIVLKEVSLMSMNKTYCPACARNIMIKELKEGKKE